MLPDLIERHAWRLYPYRHWLFWLPMAVVAILYQLQRVGAVSPTHHSAAAGLLAVIFIVLLCLAFVAYNFPSGRGALSPLESPTRPRGPWLHLMRWTASVLLVLMLGTGIWSAARMLLGLFGGQSN